MAARTTSPSLAVAGGDEQRQAAVVEPVGGAPERRRLMDKGLGDPAQQLVAGGVAEAVVVGLQPVEVEDQQHPAVDRVEHRRFDVGLEAAAGC